MDSPAKKWLKKDIKQLRGFLHDFYVEHRPLDVREWKEAMPKIRLAIESNRKEIVLAGIRRGRATLSARYRLSCETIGNQLVRFTEYGAPDELVARFIKIAREEDADERVLEALLYRVLAEGLPPEVESYDPVPEG
jgi:hypothetical protein